MRAVPWPEPDPVVAAAIRAKYAGRRVPLAVAVRDRLGQWMADEAFAAAFGVRGRPGQPPSRLAVVTVLQMMEDLGGRQAAEAVRTRLDWQYLLGLGLGDAGFDHSVLGEFRGRVAGHELEEAVLDALLARLAADGLIRAGGQQRTDSAQVIAAVRALHTTELAGESVRAALAALAAACPDWLAARFCLPDWERRYGARVSTWRRMSPGKAERDRLAVGYARDGYALVAACDEEAAPPWLRQVPAVQVLRTVLVQGFTRSVSQDGREVISRREPGDGGDGIPPADSKISSPYDGDARWGAKKDLTWLGCKLHLSGTCDDPPACGCPAAPAAGGRCGHDVAPDLVTAVAATPASVTDAEMTLPAVAALAGRDLAPGRQYPDGGYASARAVLDAARQFGVTLVTPLRADSSRQARAGQGYDRSAFAIDYDAGTVTCPQGKSSTGWTPVRAEGHDKIVVRSGILNCRPCPARELCTKAARNGRQLTILPREVHELQAAVRPGQQDQDWQDHYQRRPGIEGAISQAVTVTGCRRARYRGLRKTHPGHLYSAVALNLCRLDAYRNDTPLNRATTTHLARLSYATARTELTTNIAIAETGAAACLIRGVVLEVGAGGGSTAGDPGAGGVPDLGQVPEPGAGVVAPGLVSVVARIGAEGVEGDEQVRPRSPAAKPPGAVPSGRAAEIRRGEGDRRSVPLPGFPVFIAAPGVFLGFGPRAAVADGVAVLVGDRDAPGGLRVLCGRGGQVAGQAGVDRTDAGDLTGPFGQAEQGGQGDGQGDLPGEPEGDRARVAQVGTGGGASGVALASRAMLAGAGVDAKQQVKEGAGAQLVGGPIQAGLLQLPGPGRDALIDRMDLGGGQFPPGQARVPRFLGPALHPGLPGRLLPPFPGLVRGDLDDGARDRGPQRGRGQPAHAVQDQGLGGAGFIGVEDGGGAGDDGGLLL